MCFVRDIFGPFSQMRKVTVGFHRVWPHRTVRLTLDGFSWIGLLKIFRNMCRKPKFHWNIAELPVLYVKTNLVRWWQRWILLRTRSDSDTNCRCTKNTYFIFNILFFFSENLALYETIWRNMMHSNNITRRMRVACRIILIVFYVLILLSMYSYTRLPWLRFFRAFFSVVRQMSWCN